MIRSARDFWTGGIYIFIGLSAVLIARAYDMGAAVRMGPAYFPTILGTLLMVVGAIALIRSFIVPGIPIGAFEPLVGARPFRRPTHAGTLLASYARGPAQVTLSTFFSGKQDDSTFLSDEFFGDSMLLPNHNMDEGYQKVDLAASYRLHRLLQWYVSLENVLN